MISGGKEETVVIWKNNFTQKDFLPRLQSEVLHLEIDNKGECVSVSLKNGETYLIHLSRFEIMFQNSDIKKNEIISFKSNQINF